MIKNKNNEKLTIGILAHVDAGKTTLSEDILYLNGSIRTLGRVDHGDAFLDMYSLERERGITIFSKQATFSLGQRDVTLLDTPGHIDFSAEMERTLQILDYAILVISGADGVQSHVQTLWTLLTLYKIPVFLFINKMDRLETNKDGILAELTKTFGDGCIDFSGDIGSMNEKIALCDETVLEDYLKQGTIPKEQISKCIADRKIFPCYFGSALKVTGIEEFLTGLDTYTISPSYGSDFGARVFKITRDDQGNRLTHIKITGGILRGKTTLTSGQKNDDGSPVWEEKLNQIRVYSGSQFHVENSVEAGSVCVITGLTKSYAGEGLGFEAGEIKPILDTVLTYQIILPDDIDCRQAYLNLKTLEEEMPELHLEWKENSREIHVGIMGDVQIEVLKHLINERFQFKVELGTGSIVYKETIESAVEGVGHFEPLRHYAEVHLLIEPLPQGSGLIFDTNCSEDLLDRNWQQLVLSHLKERQHPGVLTGSFITDMKITLASGRAHKKHTVGGDFRQATYRAVRQGLKKANSILLEPYYEYRLEIPEGMIGRAMSDFQRMSGTVNAPEINGDMGLITGMVPVSTIKGYQSEVNSYTKGTGRLFCSLKGYGPCHNAEEMIQSIGYDSAKDLLNPTGSVFCHQGASSLIPWDEVEKYVHIESAIKPVLQESKVARRNMQGITYTDGDLEEIFFRTYGQSKREKDASKKSSKVIVPKSSPTQLTHTRPSGFNNSQAEEILIIDGYNIIFSWNELKELSKLNLESSRDKLLEILTNYQGYIGTRIMVVFDAYKQAGNPGTAERIHEIDVIYTKDGVTADQFIEKTVHQLASKFRITVATSDGLEQMMIFGQGALRMSARELKERIDTVNQEMRKKYLT